MTTEKQIMANKANGRKGGVKSDIGKAKIRFNARKHGILANLVAEYEEDFYKNYLDTLFDDLLPNTFLEQILVERIALHYLKLFRLCKAESEFIQHTINADTFFTDIKFDHAVVEKLVCIYSRYETTVENRMYRAISELRQIRSDQQ